MSRASAVRALGAAVLAALLVIGRAEACAVATSLRVENRTAQAVREILVSGPDRGVNQIGSGGLAPGATAIVLLPSGMGTYEVSAVLADGRVVRFGALNATTSRGLELR